MVVMVVLVASRDILLSVTVTVDMVMFVKMIMFMVVSMVLVVNMAKGYVFLIIVWMGV